MKKILIDVLGCDNPDELIDGIALAINGTENITLVACGDKQRIEQRLKDVEFDRSRLEIIDAPEEITNLDKSVNAVLMKKNSSLIKGLNMLKNREDIPVLEWQKYKDLLTEEDLDAVKKLGVLLRVAESLDRTQCGVVTGLNCDVLGDSVIMKTEVSGDAALEIRDAEDSNPEFKRAFKKNLEIL